MDIEEKRLQLFLELDDMEMEEIAMTLNTQKVNVKEKNMVGRGRSAKGCKRDYDPYESSDAFNRVKFFVLLVSSEKHFCGLVFVVL